MTSPVTAVGRLLKPKHGEPRIHQVISIDDARRVRYVRHEVIPPREPR